MTAQVVFLNALRDAEKGRSCFAAQRPLLNIGTHGAQERATRKQAMDLISQSECRADLARAPQPEFDTDQIELMYRKLNGFG